MRGKLLAGCGMAEPPSGSSCEVIIMEDCKFCCRKETKYRCTLCANRVCNVCAEPVNADGIGYDEENYREGKCPGGQAGYKARKKRVGSTSTGKRVNLFTYFEKTKEDDQEKVLTSTCIGYNENGHNNESNPDETVTISV